jgi:hypothetical protein
MTSVIVSYNREFSHPDLLELVGQRIVQINKGDASNAWYGRFENGYGFYLVGVDHDHWYDYHIEFLTPDDYNQAIYELNNSYEFSRERYEHHSQERSRKVKAKKFDRDIAKRGYWNTSLTKRK